MSDHWTDRLSDYIDGELPQGERAALEAHVATCAACAATLEQLRRVVRQAQALEPRPPAWELWPGIARAIGATPGGRTSADVGELDARRRRVSFTVPQLLAASVALVLVTGGTMWLAVGGARGPTPASAVASAGADEFRGEFAAWPTAVARYDRAVADLEQALARNRSRLDSATVRVLEQSLATIDRAIERARRALVNDPANPYLGRHFVETMQRKVALLRRANEIAVGS